MSRTREEIQNTLLNRDREEDNSWSIWIGASQNSAVKLTNSDDSNPYIRQINVTNAMLILDSTINLKTEIYRLTLVDDVEPDANASYWLSFDEGSTLEKVSLIKKQSRVKRTHWWLFFKLN